MKTVFYIILLVMGLSPLFSQKHDYHIVQKPSSSISGVHLTFVDSTNEFHFETFATPNKLAYTPSLGGVNGEFLGYFSGFYLYDSLDRQALNGDSLDLGWWQESISQMSFDPGLAIKNSSVFLSITDSLYYLFHQNTELSPTNDSFELDIEYENVGITGYATGVWYSKVRINQVGRLYINPDEKEILLFEDRDDKFLRFEQLGLVKHANGEDWWMINPKILTDEAHLTLIKSNGDIDYQGLMPFSSNNQRFSQDPTLIFSPNGKYLARMIYRWPDWLHQIVEIYEFDRCTGHIVDTLMIDSFLRTEDFLAFSDLEFSADSRKLYISQFSQIMQLDMEGELKLSEVDTIATWDGFWHFGAPVGLEHLMLLPNGKILGTSFSVSPYLHIIHNPNEKGEACNFEQRAITLPKDPQDTSFNVVVTGLPQYPHYRMPPLDEPCLINVPVITDHHMMQLVPNPAETSFRVSGLVKPQTLVIYNQQGIVCLDAQDYDGEEIFIVELPSGLYYVRVDSVVLKLVVQ